LIILRGLFILLFCASAWSEIGDPIGRSANEKAPEFEGIGITEQLGKSIDLSTQVFDEQGKPTTIGSYFDGKTPVIFSLVYYSCPGLCNLHLNGVVDTLKLLDWSVGQKFKVVALSFDPKEKADMATKKKDNYIKVYSRPGTDSGWHFLTADQDAIKKITETVGFKYRWDEKSEEWAHASAAIVLTPDGKISRYLHGVHFEPQTFKLALGEATAGKIGSFVERMVWYCFKYDEHKSKYSVAVFRIVQIGGLLAMIILAIVLLPFWWRARKS
jgi:protein SCO1